MSSSHTFFCHQPACSNMTTELGSTCDACRQDWRRCPDCGDMGASVVGSNYCHECYSRRDHPCNTAFIDYPHEHTGRCECNREDDDAEWDIWCGVDELPQAVRVSDELKAELLANLPTEGDKWSFTPQCICDAMAGLECESCPYARELKCTCDGSGRMCQTCDEESSDPCRGCGSHSLWSDRYCLKCYEVRYGLRRGPINPVAAPLPPLPPSPEPRDMSLESMRAEIAEIEVRLRGGLTKGQRDDWLWLLLNRRADLAAAEKEMWEGYDQDDLRKLDRASRY
jgi:hypothetical protein